MTKSLCLTLSAMLMVVGFGLQVDAVEVPSDRDLGLYGIEASSDGAGGTLPGVFGTQRGDAGRMDVGGTSTGVGNLGGPNEGILLSFDLSSVTENFTKAFLQLRLASVGTGWDADVVAYPVDGAWQEGSGNGGSSGDTGFPWGPAAVGDSTASFRSASAVSPGTGAFAPTDVATAGTAWTEPFGRGIGTGDLLATKLIESRVTGSSNGGVGEATGDVFATIPLTAAGVAVLQGWADGSVTNNGFNLFFETDYGDPRPGVNGRSTWRAGTREFNVAGFAAGDLAPILILIPEPCSLMLLGMGVIGLGAFARRKR